MEKIKKPEVHLVDVLAGLRDAGAGDAAGRALPPRAVQQSPSKLQTYGPQQLFISPRCLAGKFKSANAHPWPIDLRGRAHAEVPIPEEETKDAAPVTQLGLNVRPPAREGNFDYHSASEVVFVFFEKKVLFGVCFQTRAAGKKKREC